MKKNKSKSDPKPSKKATNKDARKVARKELGTNLSAKFKEVIQSLGHEADVIAKDIEKASKFLSKKLSDKKIKKDAASASLIKTLDSAIEQVKEKNSETASTPSQVENMKEKAVTVNTRKWAPVAKTPASEEPVKRRSRPVVKSPAESLKATPSSTARRGASKSNKAVEKEPVPSSDTTTQSEETKE